MPAVNEVKVHRPNFLVRFWNKLGEVDNPDATEVLEELPAEDRKVLKEASESVKFEPIVVNNAGGASSKKSIKRESSEQQKVQTVREDRDDDLVR